MLVNIRLPMLSAEYEFDIDEKKKISAIIEEVAETVCQQEHMVLKGSPSQMLMLHLETKTILQSYQNPVRAGIRNGDTLIII